MADPKTVTTVRAACLRTAALAPLVVVLAGCAAFPSMRSVVSESVVRPDAVQDAPDPAREIGTERQTRSLAIPGPPPPPTPTRIPATEAQIAQLIPDELVEANLAPQTIPQFAATVFGGLIQVPYTLTGEVATRTEVVSGGTGGTLSKRALFAIAQQTLRQYGIEVYIDGGFVTVGQAEAAPGAAPIRTSRDIPTGAGRIVQVFPVQTIEVNAIQGLLTGLFPNLGGAQITPDQLSNTLILSGGTREVAQIVRVLRELDQPRFAGSEALRIEPVYLSADNLAAALEQSLATEGFIVSRQALAPRPIVILTFPTSNQLLVFARDPALLDRVRFWVDTLDAPATLGDRASTFVYEVRNTDAQSLGQLAIGQAPTGTQPRIPAGVPGAPPQIDGGFGGNQGQGQGSTPQAGAQGEYLGGRVLVDPVSNRILFTGTAQDFASLRRLLRTLDVAAPQVAVEVMVAEVGIDDETSLGVRLFGSEVRGDGLLSGSTESLPGGSGLLLTFTGPEFRAALNAQASNNRVNILQRPQLVTRSGDEARFQVGNDVPIITSQRATDFQPGPGTGTDILQSVQYRQTGVILSLTPVVYGDRVDIQINQEISELGAATSGAIGSPTIANRSLTTRITIPDGATGVLGGLISNNYTKVNTGVPFLKDIPILGSAFQNNTTRGRRTELLILITPRIIREDQQMQDMVERAAADIDAAFRLGSGWSYTLTPFSLGPRVRGVGPNLPGPDRASERLPLFERPSDVRIAPEDPSTVPTPAIEPAAVPPTP